MSRYDPLSSMPSAGNFQRAKNESMQDTLTGYKAPPTPDHLKPFRSSGSASLPGAQSSHYAKGTPFVVPDARYGRQNQYNESTATRFAEMREPVFAPKTRPYASELREPLGKSTSYGFKLPEEVQRPEFRFGKPSVADEPAKSVIYPPGGTGVSNPTKEASYQKQRGYDWASVQIDPTEVRFGAVAKKTVGVEYNPTSVVSSATAEQRRLRNGEVGKHSVTGVAPVLAHDHVYGVTQKGESLSMKEVMAQNDLEPVADLGTTTIRSATLRKLRAQDLAEKPRDDSVIFGMPSIRADKPPPKLPKIAGSINFGDEPSANELLFPRPDMAGATAKVLASVDDAEILANRCKFGLTRAQVAQAFALAARQGPVTAMSFTKMVEHVDSA